MGSKIECFFLSPVDVAQESLRRYASKSDCTGERTSYHNASIIIGIQPYPTKDDDGCSGDNFNHLDPRWPTHCVCGYAFVEGDRWQHNLNRMFARSDGGPQTTIMLAPAGAMWHADWMGDRFRGPDGHCLVVRTPAGDWTVDGTSSGDSKGWTRTGAPPKVTAKPSIGVYGPDGKTFAYHGWLTDGVLIEC